MKRWADIGIYHRLQLGHPAGHNWRRPRLARHGSMMTRAEQATRKILDRLHLLPSCRVSGPEAEWLTYYLISLSLRALIRVDLWPQSAYQKSFRLTSVHWVMGGGWNDDLWINLTKLLKMSEFSHIFVLGRLQPTTEYLLRNFSKSAILFLW